MGKGITIKVVQGGLGRQAPGEDHISAMLFSAAAPTALGTDKIKSYNDLQRVIEDGMTKGDATYGEVYYQAAEFFRIAPGATLYLCFNLSNVVQELLVATGGKVRQLAAYTTTVNNLESVWQAMAQSFSDAKAPLQILLGYRSATALTDTAATDLENSESPNVSVLVAGDGGAQGAALATSLSMKVIPAIGAVLGAMAKAKVHESVAWVERFDFSDGTELATIRTAAGTNNPSDATVSAWDDKQYLMLQKDHSVSGTFLADSWTATDPTSDYVTIENNRTIQKVIRQLLRKLAPQQNRPVYVAPNGTLRIDTIKFWEALAAESLTVMQSAGEISSYGVYINPNQNVLATSEVVLEIRVQPVGVAREIIVNLGLAANF